MLANPASLCRAQSYRGLMVRVMTGDQVIARLFFEMTRVIHKTYMPDTRFGTFLDLVPVAMRSSWAKPKAAQWD